MDGLGGLNIFSIGNQARIRGERGCGDAPYFHWQTGDFNCGKRPAS